MPPPPDDRDGLDALPRRLLPEGRETFGRAPERVGAFLAFGAGSRRLGGLTRGARRSGARRGWTRSG
ncbi:MAG: hypothetical protein D6738_14435, partial [Acidobacteria bacterium]